MSMASPSSRVRARVQDAAGIGDPLAYHTPGDGFFFSHPGRTVVGIGAASSAVVPAGPDQISRAGSIARELLAAVAWDGDVAPCVVGALPFDGRSPATLFVPRVTILRSANETRLVFVGDDATLPEPADVARTSAPGVRLTPVPEPGSYVTAVGRARELIAAGELRKVVLARMMIAHADAPYDRRALLARLRDAEPDAYVFGASGFIGASPELLVARAGRDLRAKPLAGTIRRGDDDAASARALLSSPKDRAEHALVVEAVRAALEPWCERIDVPSEPGLLHTSTLWHLATEVTGALRMPVPSALELAAQLHPTPAVAGTPRDAAMRAIADLEAIDRTLYAGTVGWMDARGDGEWAVALRCAEVQGSLALVFAGAGIVAASEPEAELAETDAKMRAMLDALGYQT